MESVWREKSEETDYSCIPS